MIQISFDRQPPKYQMRETIKGTASWRELPGATNRIEIRLVWYTRGKGDRDLSIVDTQAVDQPAEPGQLKFELKSPRSPYGFSGKLISLIWAVEAVVFPSLVSESIEITLGPEGREVNLYGSTPAN